jgi:hypothetical protein
MMEANAALRRFARRGKGARNCEPLRQMAGESGVATPTAEDMPEYVGA